ncbi:hypothetical protein ACH5RR_023540 [Cinchona calisaya]|uniref:Uncharacterized protein n=1 Tax=Cinchona calisaya TaxID=153742 RepID=A0ABD2ZC37_9GENT
MGPAEGSSSFSNRTFSSTGSHREKKGPRSAFLPGFPRSMRSIRARQEERKTKVLSSVERKLSRDKTDAILYIDLTNILPLPSPTPNSETPAHPAIDFVVFLPIPPPPPKPISRRQRISKDPFHTMVLDSKMFLRKTPKGLLATKHSIPCLDIEIPATPNKEIKLHWRAIGLRKLGFDMVVYALTLFLSKAIQSVTSRRQKVDFDFRSVRILLSPISNSATDWLNSSHWLGNTKENAVEATTSGGTTDTAGMPPLTSIHLSTHRSTTELGSS